MFSSLEVLYGSVHGLRLNGGVLEFQRGCSGSEVPRQTVQEQAHESNRLPTSSNSVLSAASNRCVDRPQKPKLANASCRSCFELPAEPILLVLVRCHVLGAKLLVPTWCCDGSGFCWLFRQCEKCSSVCSIKLAAGGYRVRSGGLETCQALFPLRSCVMCAAAQYT